MSQIEESKTAEEKRYEALMAELAEARAKADKLEEELVAKEQEQELMRRLSEEGTRDLEAAVAIAKARISGDDKGDLETVVEQLKKEKGYLFSEKAAGCAAPRTSPAKEQRSTVGLLEKAAKKAATTGNRTDLQEYMKKKRVLSV